MSAVAIRVADVSMALYRTYRPAVLNEVVGQDHVTGPLRRALANDRVHHAYLFSGPRGCGKTSTARIMARSLNCEQGPTPDPCGVCESCVELSAEGGGSIDVIELDAASHGGVDDTRDLRERAMFAPAKSRYKIYIIDEAHMISPQGFNALLKLVEEPPPHLRFIFATTDPDKVLSTIRSRTHNYAFRLVSTKVLQEHLASVCVSEGIPAEPAALALVARAGAGSVRDSLSILGQVISGSGPEGVTYAEALVQLGMTDSALLDATIDALIDRDGAALFTVIDQVIDAGHDPRRYVSDLLERLRNLIIMKNVPDAVESGLIDEPEDQVAIELAQSQRIGAAELSRAGEVVNSSLSEFRGATAPRLHLELMAARLLLPAIDDSELGLRSRIESLERGAASGAVREPAPRAAAARDETPAAPPPPPPKLSDVAPSTAPAAAPAAAPADEPASQETAEPAPAAKATKPAAKKTTPPVPPSAAAAPAPAPTAGAPTPAPDASADLTLSGITSMWPAILDAVKSQSKVAWMLFNQSRPVSLEGGVLAVAVESAGKAANISSAGHEEKIAGAVRDVLHATVKVDVVLAPDSAGAMGTSDAAAVAADVPSPDDENVDEESGVDLAMRALGATHIGKIEH